MNRVLHAANQYLCVSSCVHLTCGSRVCPCSCFGDNTNGGLGIGKAGGQYSKPQPVAGGYTWTQIVPATDEQVDGNSAPVCGVRDDGVIMCWGTQKVLTNATNPGIPTAVPFGGKFKFVSVGLNHACGVVATNSSIMCWGENDKSQLGDGTAKSSYYPVLAAGGQKFNSVACGARFTCGILQSNRSVVCWGLDQGGLGDGPLLSWKTQPQPVPLAPAVDRTAVAPAPSISPAGVRSPPPPAPPPDSGSSSSGLSGGAIAGIVIGSLAGVGLLASGVILVSRRRANSSAASSAKATNGLALDIPNVPDVALRQEDISWDKDTATGERAIVGEGHYGRVYRGKLYGKEPVAVKCIPIEPDPSGRDGGDQKWVQGVVKEVALLKACRSTYVVNYLGYSVSGNEVQLVTELMAGGDLMVAIKQGWVTWRQHGAQIALDIASGLHYLHSRSPKVVHLDLKSSNVLLSQDYRAKITDVGLSQLVPISKSYVSSTGGVGVQGTFPYAAPEQLLGQRCTTSADVFSYGVVLWEICTGEPPVRGRMREVRVPEDCPQSVADLMQACWDPEPAKRPTSDALVDTIKAAVEQDGAAIAPEEDAV